MARNESTSTLWHQSSHSHGGFQRVSPCDERFACYCSDFHAICYCCSTVKSKFEYTKEETCALFPADPQYSSVPYYTWVPKDTTNLEGMKSIIEHEHHESSPNERSELGLPFITWGERLEYFLACGWKENLKRTYCTVQQGVCGDREA